MKGHNKIVEMLLLRGGRVNATNRGDDTPLHLAAAHGHREIVNMVGNYNKSEIFFISLTGLYHLLLKHVFLAFASESRC